MEHLNHRTKRVEDRVIFGFLGNLSFQKGTPALLGAFRSLKKEGYSNFQLRIYGGESSKNYLKDLNKLQNEYPEEIVYCGEYTQEQLKEILEEIHVGVVPSYFETYSLVLREFLSHNIPVICTRFFGSEIVKDSFNGFRVDIGDSNGLAEVMAKFIKDKGLVEKLSVGAMETEIFTPHEEAESFIRFCERLRN